MSRPANVAPCEGRWYSSLVSTTARSRAAGHRDRWGEQSVVGTDEHAFAVGDFDGDRLACAADPRIDDAEHDAAREVRDASGQRQAAGAHVERCDLVGEVDDAGVRSDVVDDCFDDADELVDEAVVGQERDGVVAAAHGDKLATGAGPARENRQGPVPTPRWHQPCRRILANATPCVDHAAVVLTWMKVRRTHAIEKRVTPRNFGLWWCTERSS